VRNKPNNINGESKIRIMMKMILRKILNNQSGNESVSLIMVKPYKAFHIRNKKFSFSSELLFEALWVGCSLISWF